MMVYTLSLAGALQDTFQLGIASYVTLRPGECRSTCCLAGLGLPQLSTAG